MCRRSPRRVELPLARQPGIDTGPDSTTDDSFDAMSIICREAPPGTGRVEQFGEDDGSVYSLQCLVVHAVAATQTTYDGSLSCRITVMFIVKY